MAGIITIECIRCGFETWSVVETSTCKKCGGHMECTTPNVTHEELSDMSIPEIEKYRKKHNKDVIADEGRLHVS